MYLLYSLLLTFGAILGLPYWIYRGLRGGKHFSIFVQRLSLRLPSGMAGPRPIWLHGVSVGEVLAAKPLAQALQCNRPEIPIVASTITRTGQELARKELSVCASCFYFPFDWRFCVRRFLRVLRPRAVVLIETELWPNFLFECHQAGIPVFLANGRISDRSLPRYRRIRRFFARLLKQLRAIGVQTHEDRKRFLELGALEARIHVTGNLKFDFPTPQIDQHQILLDQIRSALAIRPETPVLVAGSSMRGEESILLEAYFKVKSRIPETKFILAPRHPERFAEVAQLLDRFPVPYLRRSQINGAARNSAAEVLLLDTIGELRAVYQLATVAIVAGSFLPYGGHNLLEPATCGKAIIFGPEMGNFKEMARLFLREQAARQTSQGSLAGAILELLENPRARNLLGQRASAAFRQNQGATDNTLDFLLKAI